MDVYSNINIGMHLTVENIEVCSDWLLKLCISIVIHLLANYLKILQSSQ